MDDTTLTHVLDSCAHNIDLAVEQLNALQIASSAAAARQEPAQEPPAPSGTPRTPAEWISAFVTEMSRSRDVADAHDRAARALAAFEAFVVQRKSADSPGGDKVVKLERENAVLKRAVTIQAQRLQEARDASARDGAEIARLAAVTAAQTEKIKQVELSNYSLSVHLRHATDRGAGFGGSRRPDVY
mmetsp:Transcript_20971/g.72423  ORF Transcript_20971/g.72423 Transcript_20971/m.72423 type:complete len:186 (+) Transcript_20971:244-801(+)